MIDKSNIATEMDGLDIDVRTLLRGLLSQISAGLPWTMITTALEAMSSIAEKIRDILSRLEKQMIHEDKQLARIWISPPPFERQEKNSTSEKRR